MKVRKRERLFWREHDPKPDARDKAAHEMLNGNEHSIGELGAQAAWRGLRPGQNIAGIAMRESGSGPLLSLPSVCARLRVSRFTLWRMVKRGQFPAAVDIGKRRAVWRGLDVNAWCKANAAHFERVLARHLPAAHR